MGVKNIPIDNLGAEISEALNHYQRDVVNNAIVAETKIAMKSLVEKTKATAPVGTRNKHYRDNIASKVSQNEDIGFSLQYGELWFVKGSDYRLSHLLNNGHALRDGGRYEGTQFITKATDEVETAYLENLKKALENGGR